MNIKNWIISKFPDRFINLPGRMSSVEKIIEMLIENYDNVKFFSQYSQDLIAYLYFKKKKEGFFIDIGANDGISYSNTYLLEQLGWKGICIEPQPDIFLKLLENRKCDKYNIALYETSLENIKFAKVSTTGNMFSGIDITMTEKDKKNVAHRGHTIEYITVNTLTFNDLMKKYPKINNIDFMSIDVEGGEMSILRSIDFSKYHFKLIAIESHEYAHNLIEFMKNFGYKVFMDYSPGGDVFFIPIANE